MFFDTHLRLIYPDRRSYPWLADVPTRADRRRARLYAGNARALWQL